MLFKGNEIQRLLMEHMDIVLQTLSYLVEMLNNMRSLNIEKAKEIEGVIDRYEGLADQIHRKNVEKICKGSIFGYLREDILRFMELTDNIADASKEAARSLILRKIPEGMLKTFLNDESMDYIQVSIKTAEELAELVRRLDKKRDEIIEHTRYIEEIEEKSDLLKNRVLTELYKKAEDYDLLTLLQFKEFVQLIDAIADNSEDASDVVLIMIAKGYS